MSNLIDNIKNAAWPTWWAFMQAAGVVAALFFAGWQLYQTASSLRANTGYSMYKDWSNIYTSALTNQGFYKYFVLDEATADPSITREARYHARIIMSYNAAVYEVVGQKWASEKIWNEQTISICDLLKRSNNFRIYFRDELKGLFPSQYTAKIQRRCNEATS